MPSSNDGASSKETETKQTNKPSGSRLKQQKLKAWQPILTPGTVIPAFIVFGAAFIVIGAFLLEASNNIFEYVYDYTLCNKYEMDGTTSNVTCKDVINAERSPDTTCVCQIQFEIKKTINSDRTVYVYYGLSNFYQNHRRYAKSLDTKQLLGTDISNPAADCWPNQYALNATNFSWPVAPCGAIANSIFNDTFVISQTKESTSMPIELDKTGIAWSSDRKKFKNPSNEGDWLHVIQPPDWPVKADEISTDSNENGFLNESFIVWMQISALPTFRKLHSRIHSGLPKGNYTLHIDYNFPVFEFEGRKRFILSTVSWAGGKNPFLAIAYLVVGILFVLTGLVFTLIHVKYGKSLQEMADSVK